MIRNSEERIYMRNVEIQKALAAERLKGFEAAKEVEMEEPKAEEVEESKEDVEDQTKKKKKSKSKRKRKKNPVVQEVEEEKEETEEESAEGVASLAAVKEVEVDESKADEEVEEVEESKEDVEYQKKKKKRKSKRKKNPVVQEVEEEKEKVKDVEEESVEGVASKKRKPVTVNIDIVRNLGEGSVYHGKMGSTLLTISRSFIPACASQIDSIHDLIDISSNNRFLATITDLVDVGNGVMLVSEHGLQPIRSYFQEPANYHSGDCSERGRSEWWKHISSEFKQIVGDIIHGLIYLNSMGHKGGHFYVTEKGKGKVLPLMDKEAREVDDVNNLIEMMTEIITLPFAESEIDGSYNLPQDLTYMLKSATDEDLLNQVPFYWLINQPYIWSKDEKVAFVKDFTTFLKQAAIPASEVASYLQLTEFAASCNNDWSSCIDSAACGRLFRLIYDRPKSKYSHVSTYDCMCFVDIVRYCTNCYNHANDTYYTSMIGLIKQPSQHDIEEYLGRFFPRLYTDLYGALCHLTNPVFRRVAIFNIDEAFQHWSKSYFATK